MTALQDVTIPPMSGRALTVRTGQTLRIIDPQGGQPGDVVAFKADEFSVWFSQARTRVENRSVRLGCGQTLWTNTQPPLPMFTVVEDTCGGMHSLLYTPCCRYALEKRFHVSRDGCLEHLVAALRAGGWTETATDIPDPLSVFFGVGVDSAGGTTILPHTSPPGSCIALQAHMDCVVAISTCSVPVHGRENSGYQIQILAGGE